MSWKKYIFYAMTEVEGFEEESGRKQEFTKAKKKKIKVKNY